MQQKLCLLLRATQAIAMEIHPDKSLYITVNTRDTTPFYVDDTPIRHTKSYVYLGTPISNKTINAQLADHIASKQNHVRKFLSFLSKNSEAPFCVKKTVWESALTSSLLYSCETWLTDNTTAACTPYLSTIKAMLGVRIQTPTDLVHLELGIPTIDGLIKKRQQDFLLKVRASNFYDVSPLKLAMELCQRVNSPMGKYLSKLNSEDPVEASLSLLKQRVRNSQTSRCATYLTINPDLIVHPIYTSRLNVPEHRRIALTRIRLSSHYLRIETGRWSRTPREERLCQCGLDVQTECHVLLQCPQTETFRQKITATDMKTLMEQPEDELCILSYNVLNFFK